MKYLLLLGFLGVVNADASTHVTCSYNMLTGITGKCSSTLDHGSYGNGDHFYYCRDHVKPTKCPEGWAATASDSYIAYAIGAGHCFLKAANLDRTVANAICARTDGNFCPAGQVPVNGVCRSHVPGCTDQNAYNFDAAANRDDGSCVDKVTSFTETAGWGGGGRSCGSGHETTETECAKVNPGDWHGSNWNTPEFPRGCFRFGSGSVYYNRFSSSTAACTSSRLRSDGQDGACFCTHVAPVTLVTNPIDCVWSSPDPAACGAQCGTVSAVKTVEAAFGGTCADKPADHVCAHGEGACLVPVDCVWSSPDPNDCDARCRTVSAVKTVEAAFGGTCEPAPEDHVCAHGDGACSDGQEEDWEQCKELEAAYDAAGCCLEDPSDDCLLWSEEFQTRNCCSGDVECPMLRCMDGYHNPTAVDGCGGACELIPCPPKGADGKVDWANDASGAIRASCALEEMGDCSVWFDGCNTCTPNPNGGLPVCTKNFCAVYASAECRD